MKCDWVREQISWYLYNELGEDERSGVEDHLETCAACAAELDRERRFLARFDARPVIDPSTALLAEARHDLMRSIYRAERLKRESRSPVAVVHDVLASWRFWWQPAAAMALIAMGFFSGWSVRERRTAANALVASNTSNPSDAMIANIASVNLGPQQGTVQIAFDETQRRTLSGNMTDPRIQKFLIYAAKSYTNPGVRLDTVEILKDRAADSEIRNTLLYVVTHDQNDGVRLKAMEGLKPFAQDAEVRQALIGVLTKDDNPGMRVQAIDLLTESRDRSLVGILQGVAQKEDNNYIRMRCRDLLREMNASVETF